MNFETIQHQLEQAGYFTGQLPDTLFVGKNPEQPAEDGSISYHGLCRIELKENKYIVHFTDHSLPLQESFASETAVISFIRQQFPLA